VKSSRVGFKCGCVCRMREGKVLYMGDMLVDGAAVAKPAFYKDPYVPTTVTSSHGKLNR